MCSLDEAMPRLTELSRRNCAALGDGRGVGDGPAGAERAKVAGGGHRHDMGESRSLLAFLAVPYVTVRQELGWLWVVLGGLGWS